MLYIVHFTAFCLGGPFFSGHGVYRNASVARFVNHSNRTTQWSNYSIIYEGPKNMASDSETIKFFEAPDRGPRSHILGIKSL